MAIGTYGTGAEGQLTDEHYIVFVPGQTGAMGRALNSVERFHFDEDVPLRRHHLVRRLRDRPAIQHVGRSHRPARRQPISFEFGQGRSGGGGNQVRQKTVLGFKPWAKTGGNKTALAG